MIKKSFFVIYAIGGYLAGIASILYIAGFLIDFAVPKSIVDGETGAVWSAVLIDICLVLGFGLHHSITARTSFKKWWTRIIPAPIERATYLYMTAAMTALLVILWRPVPFAIWSFDVGWVQILFYAAYASVWLMMFAATFHFGHFSFMGLTQVWRRVTGAAPSRGNMTARYLYALVRHPISTGWMIAPWLTPHLTWGHVAFAVGTVAYILIATPFEERDLIDELGDEYENYKRKVPPFVPGIGRKA